MEVKIKNLFGYRNYDLKLNNKVNNLIGENGSGKSTILKMLICIFNNDFVELSKIPFELKMGKRIRLILLNLILNRAILPN